MTDVSVVDQFIQLCLRGRWHPEAWAEARRLAGSNAVDWLLLQTRVQEERIGALLYSLLQTQQLLPATVLDQLHRDYQFTGRRNLFLLHELTQVLRQLEQAQIRVIVLKGLALMETVYQDIAVRPVLDIDLLLPADQVEQALALLAEQGYEPSHPEVYSGIHLDYENEIMLQKPGSLPVPLEIHWSLLDSPHYQQLLPMAWFRQTAVSARVANVDTHVLGPEASLLHLCSHLVLHHRGDELLWLHDIAALLYQMEQQIDWDDLLRRAVQFDLVLPLQQTLSHVAAQWGAPVPQGVLVQLLNTHPSKSESRVYNWMTAETRPLVQRFWADLSMISKPQQQLRYLLTNMFPSPAYMEERYGVPHRWLLPLYYPYRWLVGVRSIF